MRNKKLGDLTVKDAVVLALFWQHVLRPFALKIDHALAKKLKEKLDQKKAKDGPEIEAEKTDMLQTLQIPCEYCGEVLCDGFCNERKGA
jgi:hypothetical protein